MAPLAPAKNLSLGLDSIFMRCALCSAADCAWLWLWQIAQKTLQEATATAAAAADFHAQQIVMRTGRQPTQTHRQTERDPQTCSSAVGLPLIPRSPSPALSARLQLLLKHMKSLPGRKSSKQTNRNDMQAQAQHAESSAALTPRTPHPHPSALWPLSSQTCHSCNRKLSHLFGYALVSHISLSTCGK